MREPTARPQDAEAAKRKPYEPPVLLDWGTLQDLTQSQGWSGKSDGGRLLFTKPRF